MCISMVRRPCAQCPRNINAALQTYMNANYSIAHAPLAQEHLAISRKFILVNGSATGEAEDGAVVGVSWLLHSSLSFRFIEHIRRALTATPL